MLKHFLHQVLKARVQRLVRAGGDAELRLAIATDYAAAADFESAARACRGLIAEDGGSARAHHLLGSVLAQQGQLPDAARSLEQALALQPANPEVLVDLGNVLCLSGDEDQALACYSRALAQAPKYSLAAVARSNLLQRLQRFDEAVDTLRSALSEPFDPQVVRVAVTLLEGTGRIEEARTLCSRILASMPEHEEAHSGAGFLALKHDLDAATAAAHLQRAVNGIDADPDLWSNLGIAVQELGEVERALACYDAALRIASAHPAALVHRALALLLRGDYARGWSEYEHRRLAPDWVPPPFDLPQWEGEELRERTLLVHSEQGIGDEILFAACVPDLMARTQRVVLECNAKLVPLFARSFPAASVRSIAERSGLAEEGRAPAADVMISAGSLPLRIRSEHPSCKQRAYLKADMSLVSMARERLERLGSGARVGFSWRGGTHKTWGAVRSIPLLALLPVLRTPGIQFVNMQYGDVAAELHDLVQSEALNVHHFPEMLADFDRTAALACALDLLISVDTTVVQLAGALGRPAWAMVTVSPDWRYGILGESMPWYESVRVFRQRSYRDWSSVIAEVADALARYAKPTER